MKRITVIVSALLVLTALSACKKKENVSKGDKTEFNYAFGRPLAQIAETGDNAYSLTYEYDDKDRVIASTEIYNSEDTFTATYEYKEDGSVVITYPEGNINKSTPVEITATFNSDGYIVKQLNRKGVTEFLLDETITYSYDEDGHLIESIQKNSKHTNTIKFIWDNNTLIEISRSFIFMNMGGLEFRDNIYYTHGSADNKLITFDRSLAISDDNPTLPTSWYGVQSDLLPESCTRITKEMNTEEIFVETGKYEDVFTYTFDGKGYIKSVSVEDNEQDTVTYNYSYAE